MNVVNLILVAVTPALFIITFVTSKRVNKNATAERCTANSLVVLSGLLTALAILIPIGATFLPDKNFTRQASLLVGALVTGVISLLCIIYSMIVIQGKEKFKPSEQYIVPSSTNATWITLSLLSTALVLIKSFPLIQDNVSLEGTTTIIPRFVVAHTLPEIGASRQDIQIQWGMPIQKNDSTLLYQTKNGMIIFCLDSKGFLQSITEMKGDNYSAIQSYCR